MTAAPRDAAEIPFLTVLLHRPDPPGLTGLCAGYELGAWRCEQFAGYLLDALPEFCLRQSELADLTPRNMARLMKRAARIVYDTEKFERRGEFGELILHVALRQVFFTVPAISKIYYKDGPNETVKGFDAVHVVIATPDAGEDSQLELWLGEAKFYNDVHSAIGAAFQSVTDHATKDYLRREFAAITNKIDDAWPFAAKLRHLLDDRTSLDSVFSVLCMPVLLTYDSDALAAHDMYCDEYIAAIKAEWETHHAAFVRKGLPSTFRVHLFLVPLNTKENLAAALDAGLKKWQALP